MIFKSPFLTALVCIIGAWGGSTCLVSAADLQKKVLIIGIDGTRPDALKKADTPHLDGLIRHGAFTNSGRILGERYQGNDTISGPGWSSILTGVWADKHGVQDNGFKGKKYELFPHFFKRLKSTQPQARTVSLVSWEPINEEIVSEADVQHVELLPPGPAGTVDLNVSADKLMINTRDGRWHHLLATRTDGKISLYLDGRLAGTAKDIAGKFDLGGTHYYLGRDTRTGATRFKGQLDNVRLWKRALDPREIETLAKGGLPGDPMTATVAAVKKDGLLAQYTFEQSDGTANATNFVDSAKHTDGPFVATPIDGTPPGAADATVPTTKGNTGGDNRVFSLPENGKEDQGARVDLKGGLRDITQGDFTVEAWFQTTHTGRNILFGNYEGSVGALNLEVHTDNQVRVFVQPASAPKVDVLALEAKRDRTMAQKAAQILTEDDPTAMFVYFHQVDATGHTIGFSPEVPAYVQAIANVDACVGDVLKALKSRKTYAQEDWLVIVCTDHGGIRTTHSKGHQIPEILTVFLIVSGPSAQVGKIEQQAYLVDVAATALTHLQGPLDPRWQLDGRAVGLKELK